MQIHLMQIGYYNVSKPMYESHKTVLASPVSLSEGTATDQLHNILLMHVTSLQYRNDSLAVSGKKNKVVARTLANAFLYTYCL